MPASFAGASSDGTRVFFTSSENFPGDSDQGAVDVFERSGDPATTKLVSQGDSVPAFYAGASADGSRVFFTTAERLDSAPDDSGGVDVYERSGGTTKLVSGGTANTPAVFRGVSSDGSRVFFETDESLLGSDSDSAKDVYLRSYGASRSCRRWVPPTALRRTSRGSRRTGTWRSSTPPTRGAVWETTMVNSMTTGRP